jgi:protein TonB
VKAEDKLYEEMFHSRDGGIMWKALIVAVVLHVGILIINFPTFKRAMVPQKAENVIIVKKYVPPPPKVERKQIVKKKLTKKVPIPDPTPDEPEPIREPEPEIQPEPLPPDVEFLIGVPEPPGPSGPLIAGAGDVTNPELIAESKVEPEYPELARVARLEGNVILQAIIRSDGTVGSIEVLRTNRPGMGFEDAAISAVQEWRYKPALQNGKAVEVYFTVFVDFKLH